LPLHVPDGMAGIAFIPSAIEVLGDGPELDDQIVGEILGLYLAALFPPQLNEGCLVVAHDNAGIRPTDKTPPIG
jgi:hypothetical protein